jgi:hypothetical protein
MGDPSRVHCRRCGADITWRGPQAVLCGDCRASAPGKPNPPGILTPGGRPGHDGHTYLTFRIV